MITSYQNRMKGKVNIWWEKNKSIINVLKIPYEQRLKNSIAIPFRNRMKGIFDIIAPERKTARLLPIEDSFVSESNSYMIFGNGSNLLIGYNNNKKYEGLLKFNLQEYFPLFDEENIIILDTKLKLTIDNVRDIENTTLNFYEVFAGDWAEESVTWNNKPIKSNTIISSYKINKNMIDYNNSTIYIDLNKKGSEITTVFNKENLELWDISTEDWSISDNSEVMMNTNRPSLDIIYNMQGAEDKNYIFSSNVMTKTDDDIIGIVFRYQNKDNYYYIGYSGGTNT